MCGANFTTHDAHQSASPPMTVNYQEYDYLSKWEKVPIKRDLVVVLDVRHTMGGSEKVLFVRERNVVYEETMKYDPWEAEFTFETIMEDRTPS
mmetsp:Transcript_67604/g.128665  ORF Transcript_67604/g.128665 Transcript_67604/m.128665 type:complete len:93 (+) Transcript_67604:3-281(+)